MSLFTRITGLRDGTDPQALAAAAGIAVVLLAALLSLPAVGDPPIPLRSAMPSLRADGAALTSAIDTSSVDVPAGDDPAGDVPSTAETAGTSGSTTAAGSSARRGGATAGATTGSAGASAPAAAPSALLRVVDAGWATSNLTSELSAFTVPDDGLPVAAVAGDEDKRTYLRLAGSGRELRLHLHKARGAQVLEENASLRACAVASAVWSAGAAIDLANAPKLDCSHRAPARRQRDGSYAFDLTSFPDNLATNGVALTAVKGDARTFQLVFARPK